MNFLEYKDEDFYFLYSKCNAQTGETNYATHSHPKHEIMFIAEGEIEYMVEDRLHVLKKGDALFVKPGVLHFAKRINLSPHARYCIGFFPECMDNSEFAIEIFDKGEHFALAEDSIFGELVRALHHKLIKNTNDSHFFYRNIAMSMISSLKDEILDAVEIPTVPDSSLKKVMAYINANLTKIKSMDDIAEDLFFSKSYLGHLFKKETNIGVMEYVRNKKVVRAHALILSGRKPTEIYLECGFSNYPSFYRTYRAFFGFSPKRKKGEG